MTKFYAKLIISFSCTLQGSILPMAQWPMVTKSYSVAASYSWRWPPVSTKFYPHTLSIHQHNISPTNILIPLCLLFQHSTKTVNTTCCPLARDALGLNLLKLLTRSLQTEPNYDKMKQQWTSRCKWNQELKWLEHDAPEDVKYCDAFCLFPQLGEKSNSFFINNQQCLQETPHHNPWEKLTTQLLQWRKVVLNSIVCIVLRRFTQQRDGHHI